MRKNTTNIAAISFNCTRDQEGLEGIATDKLGWNLREDQGQTRCLLNSYQCGECKKSELAQEQKKSWMGCHVTKRSLRAGQPQTMTGRLAQRPKYRAKRRNVPFWGLD